MSKLTTFDLPPNTWVDGYAASGITVGNQVLFQLIWSSNGSVILVSDSENEPTDTTGRHTVQVHDWISNDRGDDGLWLYSSQGATVTIREV